MKKGTFFFIKKIQKKSNFHPFNLLSHAIEFKWVQIQSIFDRDTNLFSRPLDNNYLFSF